MDDIQALHFEMSTVRMLVIDDSPWFVAQDVCSVLDHSDTSKAVSRLDDDEKLMRTLFASGQQRPVWLVNEPGLYGLVMTSRLPKANQFKRWVKHEVLPTIRTTGSYSVQQPQTVEDLIILQAQSMKDLRGKVDTLSIQLEVATRRIDNLDHVDIIGDNQQRLNALIRRYAGKNGVRHDAAWKEFTQRFNTAYRTNLTALMDNYKEKHGLRELTRPQYFSLTNTLEDALRVADKMLYPVPVGV